MEFVRANGIRRWWRSDVAAFIAATIILSTSMVQAAEQACCQINTDERGCFDDIMGSGLLCPQGNGLGAGTTCAADCDCTGSCGTCVGKQAGNLSNVEVQLIEPPVFNGTNTVYRYRVCQISGHALSHWVLGLPGACCSRIVRATGDRTTGTCGVDPVTGLFGLKFETNGGVAQCDGDCGTSGAVFTITLSGNATSTGCMKIAAKANGDENTSTACLEGPNEACDGLCTSDTHCNDGFGCTIDDCDPGNPAADSTGCVHLPDASQCNDSNPCTDNACVPGQGCVYTPNDVCGDCSGNPKGCDDGIACTIDSCDSTGQCVHTPAHSACADKNPCTDELCVIGVGCVITSDDTNECADATFCDGVEFCSKGKCEAGKPACDDGVECTDNICNELKKLCAFVPDDPSCSDGVFCNGVEICNRKKGCQAGAPPVCNDNDLCTNDLCDPATDQCAFIEKDGCDDGLLCNGVETCDPLNGCQPGTTPDCHDGVDCTTDLCNPQLNTCEHIPDDSLCSNGLFCDGTEVCNPLTGCVPGTAPDCDDEVDCTSDSCDEDNDQCLHVPNTNSCDDLLFCNGQETCDPVLDCQPGSVPCQGGLVCDEPTSSCGECSETTPCPPGPCGAPQTCVDGRCQPGTPNCDDNVSCTADFCSPATNQCEHTPDDSVCNNGLFCDGVEICNPQTGCQPGAPVNCNDNVLCTTDLCVEATSQCTFTPSDAFCDDGLFCNGTEVCHPTQGCLPGTPPNCNDAANCSVDTCNEADDRCDHACSTPQITCTDQEFECDNVGTFLPPVVNDPCSPNPVATCTDVTTPGKIPQEYTVTRSCSFTNDCGGSANCQQTVKVVDTTPPQVTCPPDKQFECDGIGDFGQPTVSDNCNPNPQVTVTVEEFAGDCTPSNAAGISPPPKLITLNTYTVTDGTSTFAQGNTADGDTTGNTNTCTQRIEIVDTHGPLIVSCPVNVSGCVGQPLDFTPPSCNDTCGTCSVLCTRSDGLLLGDPVASGPLSIHCVARDECENASAPCDVSVIVDECDRDIPTVSQWGLIVLALLLLIAAKVRFARFATCPA